MSFDVSERGARPSIVEGFRLEGLYGYRNVSLSSAYAATVLIAANGSGKTTLLAALDAFLRGQFERLRDVHFSRIICKLHGVDDELALSREELLRYLEIKPDSVLVSEARKLGITPTDLFLFVTNDFNDAFVDFRPENEIATAIYRRFNFRRSEASSYCEQLKASLAESEPSIKKILNALNVALRDIEIVYLPTYRRIELSMDAPPDKPGRRKRPGMRVTKSGLHPGELQFGLSDISERLAELNQNILVDSNQGYRQISANIINELIDGTFDRETPTLEEIPDKPELELFFSRLKEGKRVGPFNDVSVPNIDKIYGGDISLSEPTNKFLRYFLAKLNKVIGATRGIEKPVGDFIDSCNSYLSSHDISAFPPSGDLQPEQLDSLDDKILRLNRKDLKVHVESVASPRKITLDSLSSGEKQMISLFAKLYLYPKDKIVLIDEPELSLSMDWQRRILVDIIDAPLCRQAIAITHSPFIFENALEPYARALNVSFTPIAGAISPEDHGEDDLVE